MMLDGGEETFKTHDERLKELEQNQSKIMTYILAIGSGITVMLNGIFYVIGKIWK